MIVLHEVATLLAGFAAGCHTALDTDNFLTKADDMPFQPPRTPHSDMKKDELWHHQRSGISLSYKTMQKILGKKYSYESYVFWEKSLFFLNESEQIFQVFPL